MKVKLALWILSVLLGWMAGSAGAPTALANSPARGSRGCADDTWTATRVIDAPSDRTDHTAVWTGTEMIIWGRNNLSDGYLNTGGRYDPTTDTWVNYGGQ